MIPATLFIPFFLFAVLLNVYGFIGRDETLYTHILAAFFSGILEIILGYFFYGGILFYSDSLSTVSFQSSILANALILWGLFIMIFSVVKGWIVLKDHIEQINIVPTWKTKLEERKRDGDW